MSDPTPDSPATNLTAGTTAAPAAPAALVAEVPAGSWWSRNRQWFIPVVILVPSVLTLSCLSGVLLNVFMVVKQSETYKMTVAAVEESAWVEERTGRPLDWSTLAMGRYETDPETGDRLAKVIVTASGPRGKVYVQGQARQPGEVEDESTRRWELKSVVVTPDAGDSMDLITGEIVDVRAAAEAAAD